MLQTDLHSDIMFMSNMKEWWRSNSSQHSSTKHFMETLKFIKCTVASSCLSPKVVTSSVFWASSVVMVKRLIHKSWQPDDFKSILLQAASSEDTVGLAQCIASNSIFCTGGHVGQNLPKMEDCDQVSHWKQCIVFSELYLNNVIYNILWMHIMQRISFLELKKMSEKWFY